MLLFRGEGDVRAWCEQRQTTPGAVFDLERLWTLAGAWYDDRLDPNWRRRTIAQRQAILDAVGLVGPFWRLIDEAGAFAQTTEGPNLVERQALGNSWGFRLRSSYCP